MVTLLSLKKNKVSLYISIYIYLITHNQILNLDWFLYISIQLTKAMIYSVISSRISKG